MLKFYIFSIILVLISIGTKAQSIGPSTVNSAGGGNTLSGNSYDYSIGELTVIETGTNATGHYTQGVLQPHRLKVDGIYNINYAKENFAIYPNPANEYLIIESKSKSNNIKAIQLIDNIGNTVFEKNDCSTSTQIDMRPYAVGSYIIKITTTTKQYTTLKISKTN